MRKKREKRRKIRAEGKDERERSTKREEETLMKG